MLLKLRLKYLEKKPMLGLSCFLPTSEDIMSTTPILNCAYTS